MVLLVTWSGYPGVVCVTSMAWLIALRVGNICVARSTSIQSSRRLLEAALAGGLFGFLQGLLFWVMVPLMGPIKPSEQGRAIVLSLFILVVGVFAGASLSFFTAYFTERRHRTST
jgi:hypothetical protein